MCKKSNNHVPNVQIINSIGAPIINSSSNIPTVVIKKPFETPYAAYLAANQIEKKSLQPLNCINSNFQEIYIPPQSKKILLASG